MLCIGYSKEDSLNKRVKVEVTCPNGDTIELIPMRRGTHNYIGIRADKEYQIDHYIDQGNGYVRRDYRGNPDEESV